MGRPEITSTYIHFVAHGICSGREQEGWNGGLESPRGCWRGLRRVSGQSTDTSAVPDYVATSLITRQPATILDPTAWNEAVRGPSPSWLSPLEDGERRDEMMEATAAAVSADSRHRRRHHGGWVAFCFTNVDGVGHSASISSCYQRYSCDIVITLKLCENIQDEL